MKVILTDHVEFSGEPGRLTRATCRVDNRLTELLAKYSARFIWEDGCWYLVGAYPDDNGYWQSGEYVSNTLEQAYVDATQYLETDV